MIEKSIVRGLVEEWLEGRDYFLVDVAVSADDRIVVEIDHAEGVWIEDCVELSRFIESRLSREEEDYELEVGSAGIGQPFKVLQQYVNHVGSEVDVLTADGRKLHGVLKRAGLPRVRFHDLRHTFAMLALQNGVDIKTVSGMLGHFSAGFTLDTYAHVTTAAQKEAARTMEKVLTAAI